MQLCHTVTIASSNLVTHAVRPCAQLTGELVLRAPTFMSFSTHAFAAIRTTDAFVTAVPSLAADVKCSLHLHIVDEMEQRSLLDGVSSSQAIFMLGEIIDGIAEALCALDFTLHAIAAVPKSPELCVDFTVHACHSTYDVIGSALCLNVVVDALLCARGLRIREAAALFSPSMADDASFMSTLQQIWGRPCSSNMRPA